MVLHLSRQENRSLGGDREINGDGLGGRVYETCRACMLKGILSLVYVTMSPTCVSCGMCSISLTREMVKGSHHLLYQLAFLTFIYEESLILTGGRGHFPDSVIELVQVARCRGSLMFQLLFKTVVSPKRAESAL